MGGAIAALLSSTPRRVPGTTKILALVAVVSLLAMAAPQIIDSHIHVWTPDIAQYPRADGAPPIPDALTQPGTVEQMVAGMQAAGIKGALIVQAVNYGQDYSYMLAADAAFPGFFKGMMVADPAAPNPVQVLTELVQSRPSFWVGVRFNPYKWPEAQFADEAGHALFAAAGQLGLPVGLMAFKGMAQHSAQLEELLKAAPSTRVVLDHWGFVLQPATGFGDDREFVEDNWNAVLALAAYPQVHVKLSAMFRNGMDGAQNWISLAPRLEQLLASFGAERILWGSDAPYLFDFGTHTTALQAMQSWPLWGQLDQGQQDAILSGTAEKLFGTWSEHSEKEL